MNRYEIIKHPELEPCNSEQAFIQEIKDTIEKEVRESLTSFVGTKTVSTQLASTLCSAIPEIRNVCWTGTNVYFDYDFKNWTVSL